MASTLRLRALGPLLAAMTALFAMATIGSPAPALAQDEVGEARALFMAGRSAYNEGRYQAALNYFQQSYELSGKPLLLFNIAQCHDRLRNDDKAIETFEAYLAAIPDASNRKEVEARLKILKGAVAARQPAEPPAPIPEATPEPETSATDELPAEEPIPPMPEPEPVAAATADYDLASDGEPLPIGPIIVVSAGAAAIIAGIVMIAVGNGLATDLQDEVDAARGQGLLTQSYVDSQSSTAEAPLIGGQVLLGLGLAAAAGGAVWWATGSGERRTAAGVRISPLAGGVALDGRF